MATWMTHFRVADALLGLIDGLDAGEFIAGNIGPDCGEPNEDWTVFTPPKEVTHWYDENRNFRAEDFYSIHITPDEADPGKRSFLLGYYVHLLTDTEWKRQVYEPKMNRYRADIESDIQLIRAFKRDWYDCDHLFLRVNPDFHAFHVFAEMHGYTNDYLDYFQDGAILRQMNRITNYYLNPPDDIDHEYKYLCITEITDFVSLAADSISRALDEKGYLVYQGKE